MLTIMPDEPRRSGRATKGQHKNLELPDAPSKKGKTKGQKDPKDKSGKASAEPTPGPSEGEEEDDDDEEIIRCICGEYEEEEDVERDMICCDQCSAWQHNDCMGLTFPKGQEPDQYYCERCKPENHKALLEKIAKGEKPWEEVAERRRLEAEEKKSKRKKGKKGTRKSQGKPEASTPARAGTSATPGPGPSPTTGASASAEPEKNGHGGDSRRSSTNKRKLEESVEADMVSTSLETRSRKRHANSSLFQGPQVKQQRVSPQSTTGAASKLKAESPADTPAAGATLEALVIPARKSAATALIRLFVDQITAAQKKGSYSPSAGKSAEDAARQLGLSIEDAMYHNFCGRTGEPTEPYKLQLRTILFNVKKNPSLRDRLLVGSLSPDSLARMKPEEMASEELQQKDAEIKRESERQHIIVQEQGPRIRRTHKGEELVEDETHTAATESVFSAGPRRAADADGSPGNQSPLTPKVQQSNKFRETEGHARGRSPTGGHHDHVFPELAPNIREPVPSSGKIQADAEIDQLLRDEEPDSPPYSPKDFNDDNVVWHGKVAMIPVSEFTSFAKHVGGADLSGRIPWSQLAPSTLLVDGRIDIQLASSYLCGLRFSSSTDVSVIAISSPDLPGERAGFDKLFDYFQNRQRYGVIGKHPLSAVKDTYIIPIEAGTTTKPEFIELLENNTLDSTINERTLLVVFVVKTGDSNPPSVQPPSHQPSQEPAVSASPLTAAAATPQQPNFMAIGQATTPQVAPTPPTTLNGTVPNPAAYAQPQATQPGQFPPLQQQALTGLAAAVQVLGAQVNAPAIQQLLKTAPNVDVAQLNVVRDILARQPAAAANYDTLMQALFETQANGHVPPANV
ncbi:Zinc finger PHD-type [Penicillium canariense]|uniref:Transcription factor BYE1 n=1 Tax=Penicillium canariense TaxID=189055 RepID=A0A9W9I8P4_9EURO|nr:Zinc finger PHD-type [Penicillium canariense]KAJ5168605.1 Zinc finger PHD-type [Penicillium canariense]